MATNTEKGRAEREEASQSTIFSRKLQTHFCSNISDSFFSTHPLQQSCNSPGRKQKEEVLSPTSSPEKTSQQVVWDHEASMIHRKSMEKGSDCPQVATIEYRFQWHEAAIKAETRVFSRTCLTSVRQSLFSLLAREPRVAVPGPWRTALCMLLSKRRRRPVIPPCDRSHRFDRSCFSTAGEQWTFVISFSSTTGQSV